MKKVLSIILIAVMALSIFTACSKKEEATTKAPQSTEAAVKEDADSKKVSVSYPGDDTISASAILPNMGGIEEDKDTSEGVGYNYVKVYSTEKDNYTYIDADLAITIVTQDYKNSTMSGKRYEDESNLEKTLTINGYEACLYNQSKDDSRKIEYVLFGTKGEDIVEFSITLSDVFSDFSEADWQKVVDSVAASAAFDF